MGKIVKGEITAVTMLIYFSFLLSFSSGAVSSHVLLQLCHIRHNEAALNSKTPSNAAANGCSVDILNFKMAPYGPLCSPGGSCEAALFLTCAVKDHFSPTRMIRSERVCTWTPFEIRMKFGLYGAFLF